MCCGEQGETRQVRAFDRLMNERHCGAQGRDTREQILRPEKDERSNSSCRRHASERMTRESPTRERAELIAVSLRPCRLRTAFVAGEKKRKRRGIVKGAHTTNSAGFNRDETPAGRGEVVADAIKQETPECSRKPGFQNKSGIDLLSHAVTHIVPSALRGLTALFGMGRGVTPSI